MVKKTLLTLIIFVSLVMPAVSEDLKKAQNVDNIKYQTVSALDLVAKNDFYLNKNVRIIAVFNKFSTLGLDYKPALRDSKDYISFLIRRKNYADYTIPLSELKIFIKRDKAEKLVDLESGDKIEIKGKVFSTALGDTWMDAEEVKILEQKNKKEVKDKK